MKTMLFILGIVFVIALLFLIITSTETYNEEDSSNEESTDRLYQGPVPPDYDEEYYRKTGITRLKSTE